MKSLTVLVDIDDTNGWPAQIVLQSWLFDLAASISSGGSQMKSRYIRPYSKREKKAMGETAERQTRRSLEKVQWVMIVAMNDALGVGEERFLRAFDRYTELLEEYGGFKEDEVADEMLSRRVKQILPKSFTKLYQE